MLQFFSQKVRLLAEIVISLLLMFGYLWIVFPSPHDWIKVVSACPILAFLLYSTITHKERFRDIGFALKNWYYPAKINLVFIVIAIPLLCAVWNCFFPFNKDFQDGSLNWYRMLFAYPLGALCQQYLFFGFFFRRYNELFAAKNKWAFFFTALTFSAVHWPNPSLLLLTFIAGLVWAKIYSVQPNLYVNAVSHALLGVFALFVLGVYGEVGTKANSWQWSKSQSINGYIVSVNSVVPKRKDGRVIKVGNQADEIIVRGFIEDVSNLKNVCLTFNGKDYLLKQSLETESLDFIQRIPVHNLKPGDYKLLMKVLVKEKHVNAFYDYPGKEITIRKLPDNYFNNPDSICKLLQDIKVKSVDGKVFVISNVDVDLLESEYKFEVIELNRVFSQDNPDGFKKALNFIENREKNCDIFILLKDSNNALSKIFQSDNFKKFLSLTGQNQDDTKNTCLLFHYL